MSMPPTTLCNLLLALYPFIPSLKTFISLNGYIQLVHDLDLAVYSPDGTRFSMWGSGHVDAVNNVERVIVPAETVAEFNGTWGVRVWSKRLAANETQAYALVVTGAIAPPEENGGTVARVRETSTMTSLTSSTDT